MKVYVVFKGWEEEGGKFVGVFSTLGKAQQFAIDNSFQAADICETTLDKKFVQFEEKHETNK